MSGARIVVDVDQVADDAGLAQSVVMSKATHSVSRVYHAGMRLFIVVALACASAALYCAVLPASTVLSQPWDVWVAAAFVAFFLDLLVGGRVDAAIHGGAPKPPA